MLTSIKQTNKLKPLFFLAVGQVTLLTSSTSTLKLKVRIHFADVAHKWITNGQNRTGPFVDQSQFNSLTKKKENFILIMKFINCVTEEEYSDGEGSVSERRVPQNPPVVAAVIPNSPVRGQYSKRLPKEDEKDKRRSARNKRKPATSSSSSSKKQKLAPKEEDPFYLQWLPDTDEINDDEMGEVDLEFVRESSRMMPIHYELPIHYSLSNS